MSRITCRNGLVWQARLAAAEQGRRARFVFVAAIGLGLVVTSARGGSLDAPAGPTDPNSAMWTLNDIYNKLNTWTNIAKRTGAFTEPTAGPTSGTMHTLNEIMTLVTNSNHALVPKTGQMNSSTPYDDGWYGTNLGVAWPNPRFTVLGDTNAALDLLTNCVRDNLTGLIWARNANLASGTVWSVNGTCTWATAFNVITNSAGPVNGTASGPNGYGGTNDWRLPNFNELYSLVDSGKLNPALPAGHPFTGVQLSYYWSSTTPAGTANALIVALGSGTVNGNAKSGVMYVWPVRGGQ